MKSNASGAVTSSSAFVEFNSSDAGVTYAELVNVTSTKVTLPATPPACTKVFLTADTGLEDFGISASATISVGNVASGTFTASDTNGNPPTPATAVFNTGSGIPANSKLTMAGSYSISASSRSH